MDDNSVVVEYGAEVPAGMGVRDTVRNTNFRFRHDALTPSDISELTDLNEAISIGLHVGSFLQLQIISLFGVWSDQM